MTDHEDSLEEVPGAAAAERMLRARQYAALQLIASLTDDHNLRKSNFASYCAAGLLAEVVTAQAELVQVYLPNPAEVLEELRRMVEPVLDLPNGPGPDAENYRVGTVEDCPDDGLEWPDAGPIDTDWANP